MEPQRKLSEIAVRIIVLLLGLFILAQGIAFTILADLGTDAITSPALVIHKIFGATEGGMGIEFCSVGRMLIVIHCVLIFLQIVLLRRKYQPVQLLQVVNAFILGSMVDFCTSYTTLLPEPEYTASIAYTLTGCIFCAFGIFTFVKADLVPLSAEGFCLALHSTFKWRFSRIKVALDCAMLLIAVVASLIFLGYVAGVREGSIICALSTGCIIGWLFKACPLWDKFFTALHWHTSPDPDSDSE